jgi:hypothetical protein
MKKLYINKATYFVGDDFGNDIVLSINYWENSFDLKVAAAKDDNIKKLEKEARELAQDLLKRKSRVNCAK